MRRERERGGERLSWSVIAAGGPVAEIGVATTSTMTQTVLILLVAFFQAGESS